MKLTLILSTYNQPLALDKVLRGLQRQSAWADEFLIADDGSGESTRKLLLDWQRETQRQLRHIWHPDEGFRKTVILNKAVAASSGDYLVLLDGDCVPHTEFIADHRKLAKSGFWVQGRRCFVLERFAAEFESGRTPILRWLLAGRMAGAAKALRFPVPLIRHDTGQRGILGCNMGIWRQDVVDVNGFDEEYVGWGNEDSDLGTRLYHLGRPRRFVYGRALVYHLNHPMLPRDHFAAGRARLEETLRSRRIRCERGLDHYLPLPA
jgi:glycosyltransferase involved in cell wall biosynthesis